MFRGGVLLEDINKTSSNGEPGRGRRKLPIIITIVLTALAVAGFGYILYWRSTSSITPVLGNVDGTLTGCEYDSSTPFVPREVIPVTPTITNTGNVPMYGFIEVSIPYSTVDGSVVEWYETAAGSGWTSISRTVGEDVVSYVFSFGADGLLSSIEPDGCTSPLFTEDAGLTVGPIGLLDASQRSEERQVLFTAYGSQTGGDIEGLDAIQAFEAVKSEIGEGVQP